MADDTEGGGGEGGTGTEATTTTTTSGGDESADLGFYNRKLHNFPLVRVSYKLLSNSANMVYTVIETMFLQYSDMNEEMRVEAMELCVTACEKHPSSNEVIHCTVCVSPSSVLCQLSLIYVFI